MTRRISRFNKVVIALCLCMGATSASTDSGPVQQINPTVISYGKQTDVTVQLQRDVETIHLYPGGPQLIAEFSLPYRPQFLAASRDYFFVITEHGVLEVRDSLSGNKRTGLKQDTYQWVGFSNDLLWVVAVQGDVVVYDVLDDGSLSVRAEYQSNARIQDAVIDRDNLYIATTNSEIMRFDVGGRAETKPHIMSIKQHADFIAVNGDTLIVATKTGEIRRYLLTDEGVKEQAFYRTSLPIYDIKMSKDYVYVAQGKGGVLVLALAMKGQLTWVGSHSRLGDVRHLQYDETQSRLVLFNHEAEVIVVDVALPMMPTTLAVYDAKTSIYAMTLHDENVIVAQEGTLKSIDFSATPPQLSNQRLDSGQGVNFGGERRLFIEDDIAYVADWFSGMHIYDISNPARIKLLSSYHTPGSPKGVVVKEGYAYIADDDHGLHIVDVRNLKKPKYAASLLTPGLAYIPKIVGDHLYLASHRAGFQILDISKPLQPKIIANIDTPGMSWGIDIVDNKAYIADDAAGLLIYDVVEPSHPKLLGQFNPDGRAEDVQVQDHVAYVTFFDKGLMTVNVTDAANPELLAVLATPGNARGVDLDQNYAYIADWLAGVHVVDISDASSLRLMGSYDTSGAAWGLAYNKGHVFVMDWWGGVVTLDVSNPRQPQLKDRYHERGVVEQIVGQDNYLYSANGEGGLQVFDNKNPLNPIWVTGADLSGNSIDVAINKTRAYVISDVGLLSEIDISNPFQIHQMQQIELHVTPKKILLSEHFAYILTAEQRLLRVDIGEKMRSEVLLPDRVNDIVMYEDKLYIASQQAELIVFDPSLKSMKKYVLADTATLLDVRSNQLITYHEDHSLKSHRLKAAGLKLLNEVKLGKDVIDLSLADDSVYVLTLSGSLLQYSTSELTLSVEYPLIGNLTQLWSGDNAIYIAGDSMITALKLLPKVNFISINDENQIFEAAFPRFMPLGSYNLNIRSAGFSYSYPNAIIVEMSFSNSRIHCDNQSLCGDQ